MSLLKTRGLALFSALAIVVGACGGAASPTPAASPAPGATATPVESAIAATSDNFTFVIDSEPSTFAGAPDDLPTAWIAQFLYTTLYQPNYKVEYVPLLADGQPETTADGLTWTVKIKGNAKFHDGSPITADDVKFSFDLLKSPNCRQNPDLCSSINDNVESITVKDPTTVVMQLKQKYAPFKATGLGSTLIMPKAAIEASFGRFQTAAGAVTADEVKAVEDKIKAGTEAAECGGDAPPPTCDLAAYVADLEAILGKAGIALPDRNAYNIGENNAFDPSAYGQALKAKLDDLQAALTSTAIDQIAASLKIIDFASNPVGSGPYKFVKYTPGENVELAAFQDYYGGGTGVDPKKIPPKAFAVVIRDSAAATAALGNDDIQWQQKIESDAYKTVKDNPNVQIGEYADNGYFYIAFNMREGHIYADKNLRTAWSMCIDHDKTVEVATDGNGVPVYANTPPFSWAFNPDTPKYTLDVAGAKSLIESSGWTLGSDGVYAKGKDRLSTKLYVRKGRPQRLAFAQLAKDQLKECGIDIEIIEGDLVTVLIPTVLDYPNKFETYLGGWSTSLDPDDYSIFHSTEIPTEKNPSANNFPGWKSAQADQLLEQGRQELDQAKRAQLYFQFQSLIHDELPYYFLWADKAHTGFSKRVVSQNEPIELNTVGNNYYNVDAWVVTPK